VRERDRPCPSRSGPLDACLYRLQSEATERLIIYSASGPSVPTPSLIDAHPRGHHLHSRELGPNFRQIQRCKVYESKCEELHFLARQYRFNVKHPPAALKIQLIVRTAICGDRRVRCIDQRTAAAQIQKLRHEMAAPVHTEKHNVFFGNQREYPPKLAPFTRLHQLVCHTCTSNTAPDSAR